MGNEFKVGLAVIGGLTVVLAGAAWYRFAPAASAPPSLTSSGLQLPQKSATPLTTPAVDSSVVPTAAYESPDAPSRVSRAVATSDVQGGASDTASQPRPSFMPQNLDANGTDASTTESGDDIVPGSGNMEAAQPGDRTHDASADGRAIAHDRLAAHSTPGDEPLMAPVNGQQSPDDSLDPGQDPMAEGREQDAVVPTAGRQRPRQGGDWDARPLPALPRRAPSRASSLPRFDVDLPSEDSSAGRYGGRDGGMPGRAAIENGKYTVQPNDTFWTISQKAFGTGGYFKALIEHNRRQFPRPSKLQVGDVVDVPAASVLDQTYPQLCPKPRRRPMGDPLTTPASARQNAGRVYVVEQGDTLFDIARYELGKASRWAEIYDLNREMLGDDFDYLQPGTELVLPHASQEEDSLTRQQDSTFQR